MDDELVWIARDGTVYRVTPAGLVALCRSVTAAADERHPTNA